MRKVWWIGFFVVFVALLLIGVDFGVKNVRFVSSNLLILDFAGVRLDKTRFGSWLELVNKARTDGDYLVMVLRDGRPVRKGADATHSLTNNNMSDVTHGCDGKRYVFHRVRVLNVTFDKTRYAKDGTTREQFNKVTLGCLGMARTMGAKNAQDLLIEELVLKFNSGEAGPFLDL